MMMKILVERGCSFRFGCSKRIKNVTSKYSKQRNTYCRYWLQGNWNFKEEVALVTKSGRRIASTFVNYAQRLFGTGV